ncbi:MAG: hypothetical protein ACP5I4_00075 [Oceanipulchritudo sp.]
MLPKKTKGLFVEVNGFSYLVAAATGLTPPFSIEAIAEFPRGEPEKLKEYLDQAGSGRRARYIFSHCGIIPESRFFRLHTLESMAKARDAEYFNNILEQQFRINPKSSRYSVVSVQNGRAFDTERSIGSQKELLLCGADAREFNAFQDNLVECGVYPQSLQLGTLSSLAGLKHYLRSKEIEDPVLHLEVTQNSANLFILSKDKVDLCRPVNFGFNAVLPVIRQELGLKDEESARNLFFSDTFDFREIGPKLLARILKELNASTGFYEVQTGQTIPHLYMTSLPENLGWIPEVIAREMDIKLLDIDWEGWAEKIGVSFGDACSPADLGPPAFGLFSLFINFEAQKDGRPE